jgi:hypothetical protein
MFFNNRFSSSKIILILYTVCSFSSAKAQNWPKFDNNSDCKSSFILKMKPMIGISGNSLIVSKDSDGFLKNGKLLGNSKSAEVKLKSSKYDTAENGYLDIGVKYINTKNNIEKWIECNEYKKYLNKFLAK